MEYMLVLFSDPRPLAAMKPAEMEAMAGAYYAFTQALQKEGAFKDSRRLRPAADATTVHLDGGKSKVFNRPPSWKPRKNWRAIIYRGARSGRGVPANSTMFWISMESRTSSKFTQALTLVKWLIASRIT